MRKIIDRIIVVVLILVGLYVSRSLASDQFHIEPVYSNMYPGGRNIGLSFLPIILAFVYQIFIAQDYENKIRDAIFIVMVFGLLCTVMVKLGLAWMGTLLVIFSLLSILSISKNRQEVCVPCMALIYRVEVPNELRE